MATDLADFGHLQQCYSEPGFPQTDPDCQDALLDIDADVDTADFAVFEGCMSGADVPADFTCAGG
jgi:hypothetical protein